MSPGLENYYRPIKQFERLLSKNLEPNSCQYLSIGKVDTNFKHLKRDFLGASTTYMQNDAGQRNLKTLLNTKITTLADNMRL
jgi:hypothetical protein